MDIKDILEKCDHTLLRVDCTGEEIRTQYSRTGSETNEDDMILLVTGMAPVLYSDGSGYVSMA